MKPGTPSTRMREAHQLRLYMQVIGCMALVHYFCCFHSGNVYHGSVLYPPESHKFELRAFIFCARSLIGSDSSGLSDPFARVIIANQCKTTQVSSSSGHSLVE